MTPEEAVEMLKAKLDCMCRSFSGIDEDCNTSNCDNCKLNYEQGTVGEQKEALSVAISALQEQDSKTRRCATCKHDPPSKKWPCVDCDMREPADRWKQRDAGDTISRQAAIDALSVGKELLSRVLDDMDVVGADREKYSWGLGLIEANIKDIEELPSAQPEQRWIPVTERLPGLWDEIYLVSFAWGGVGVMEYKSTGFHHYGSLTPVPIETVTAWMPRPEPYKAERSRT